MFKKIVLSALLVFLICCKNDDENNVQTFDSEGVITGIDLTLCPCCGGFFIDINDETYNFEPNDLPNNDLEIIEDNVPIFVELNWENTECGNLITISAIREL